MTATLDNSSRITSQLISTCQKSREGFRSAAEAVQDAGLRRLLDLYAQQRTRFAEELREYIPDSSELDHNRWSRNRSIPTGSATDLLQFCLEADEQTLAIYRQALADRGIPTKLHFLISAQFSLLQRVRDRIHGLLSDSTGTNSASGIRAAV